jgi:hypothetical protein
MSMVCVLGRQRIQLAALCWAAVLCSHTGQARRLHAADCSSSSSGSEQAAAARSTAAAHGFIFVYDMPADFTDDLRDLPVQWHPEQYDYDQARALPAIPAE